ncbi:MAG: VWA domain-containing protein [Acidobacteriia bacterium]|nr:VWA domain-containing protein [Terriglobia bacterium]
MNSTGKWRAALGGVGMVLLIGLWGARAAGQEPKAAAPAQTAQEETQARIRGGTSLVVVPVIVKDDSGRLVDDLTREEFRIFEDNVEQRLEVFSNDPFPLSVVLLIDNDLDPRVAQQLQETLPVLAASFSKSDEVCVARFDQFFRAEKGFTSDPDELLAQLHLAKVSSSPTPAPASGPFASDTKINGIPIGGGAQAAPSARILHGQPTKAVDDAVFAAAQLLKDRGRERRKFIFLISDGVNSKLNKVSFQDTARALLTGGISVYGVGVGNAFLNRRITTVSRYAHATGGDVFYASKREEVERLYSTVTEEVRNQYTLAYAPKGTDRSLEFHAVEIRVKRPGLSILARDGYYSGAAPQ